MGSVNVDLDKLVKECSSFDFLRFTLCDLNGISKGKVVPARWAKKFVKKGISFYLGAIAIGPNTEIPITITNKRDIAGHGNIHAKPVFDTVHDLTWSTEGTYKVGEILCEPHWDDGTVQEASPRFQARKQLEKLDAMGLKLWSAFEVECYIVDKDTLEPINKMDNFLNNLHLFKHDKLLFGMEKHLLNYGVDLETIQCEGGPGQFEFSFPPCYGINSADQVFKFKNAVKEICLQKGYHATFMTKPFAKLYTSGTHFNFSIWDKSEGSNVFHDGNEDDKLSKEAQYFIGGILKHGKAVTALCNPTANCYRRMGPGVTPTSLNWDIDNRFMSVRVKNLSKEETYIENRIPSGSANPYIVMAATLAAGIDGIKKKIQPPKKREQCDDSSLLPQSLAEAVSALESNQILIDSMGDEFVDWFLYCKKEYDLKKFKDHDMKISTEAEVEKERSEYFEML